MTPPAFWARDGLLPALLSPLAAVVARMTAARVARPGWRAPVPVLCVGNAGVGGAGKTPVVLDLARRWRARGMDVHCLSRGYGGRATAPLRVDPARHDAALVGDEPLLLAQVAPSWVGPDRAASARAAIAAGAAALLLDDGLQNPGLAKSASLLVIDGEAGFGNGRVLPAGPLREPVAAAAARCRAAVLLGADRHGAAPPALPALRADLLPDRALAGARVLAFCGIGRPPKFFATAQSAGADLAATRAFPDHHRYTARELDRLVADAARLGARLLTTAKDAVRLPPDRRAAVDVLGVTLRWQDEAAVDALLGEFGPGIGRP